MHVFPFSVRHGGDPAQLKQFIRLARTPRLYIPIEAESFRPGKEQAGQRHSYLILKRDHCPIFPAGRGDEGTKARTDGELRGGVAGARGARAGARRERPGRDPQPLCQAAVRAPHRCPAGAGAGAQHSGHRPRRAAARGRRRQSRRGRRGGVPGVGLLSGGQPRGAAGADARGAGGVARLLPPPARGEAAVRQLAAHVRGVRQQARRAEGRRPGLGRLLLPTPRAGGGQELGKVLASKPRQMQGGVRGVRVRGGEAVQAADAGAVREPGAGRGALPAGVRRRRVRRHPARQLLPAVPAAGPHARPLPALRPRRAHRPPRRRARPRPAGPQQRRRVGHCATCPRRVHRQRRRPDPDPEQLYIQERGTPGDRERQGGAHLPRALLQPEGRRPDRTGSGARHGGGLAGALPSDDLRRVQALHKDQGRQGQGTDRGSQGPGVTSELVVARRMFTLMIGITHV